MFQSYTPTQSIHHKSFYSPALVAATLAVMVAIVLGSAPPSIISATTGGILGACGLVVLLYASLGSARAHPLDSRVVIFRLTLLIWWYVLLSEQLFDRPSDPIGTEGIHNYEGQFAPQAYGETLIWVVSFLFLMIILLPRLQYLRRLFSGSQKWASLFATVCVLSVAYTPAKLYALGWSFKLLLVVLLLTTCSDAIDSLGDMVAFFKATLWAFFFLTVFPLIGVLSNPGTPFDNEGRLKIDPDGLSERAGSLLVIALMLYSLQKRGLRAVIAFIAALVMILSLGKTGIIAGTLSAALFFLLRKKVGSSLCLLFGMIVLGVFLFAVVSPLTRYVESYRALNSLTGRTAIWTTAIPAIQASPILGHGYLASRFFWLTERDPVARASHLHNGFLDVAYNNGAAGLVLILLMHFAILKHLVHSISRIAAFRKRANLYEVAEIHVAYILATGSLALYLNLLINGLLGATFGGRAISPFELFLALLMAAERLAAWTDNYAPPLVLPNATLADESRPVRVSGY